MWTFMMVFVFLTAGCRTQTYNNFLNGILYKVCSSNQVVSEIRSSAFSSSNSDRQWKIECQPFPTTKTCSWMSFFGSNGQDFNFACPANYVVRGVYSEYQSAYKTRKWSFQCCNSNNVVTFDCQNDTIVNYWNEQFIWRVPGGNFLTGVSAQQKNVNGDQRWRYTYCRAAPDSLTVSSQIIGVNDPVQSSLTQGDIPVRLTRNAAVCTSCKWPTNSGAVQVPYVMSTDFSSSETTAITNAMDSFSMSTCVEFVPLTTQLSHVNIVKESGCWSYVGRQGGAQKVSLGNGCIYYGIIQHELMHALNFWHEQNRNDRDSWIRINFENIQTGKENNFEKLNTDNLGVEYDYNSVMHYRVKDFSGNGKDTITPLIPSASVGQRFGMSESDVLKINKLYSCSAFLPKYGEWDNELGGVLSVPCASGQVVSRIKSSVPVSDGRQWRISCKAFQKSKNPPCQWSNYVNELQGAMDFRCPDNQVVGGVYAEPSSVNQDRKWKFQCCRASNFITYNFKNTPFVNYWRETFDWPVPSDNYLAGVKSSYDSQTHDRRWSFNYCQGKYQM